MLKQQIQTLVDLGFSITAISKQTGVGEASIRHWLKGIRGLGGERQNKLALFVEQIKKDIENL